MQYTIVCKGSAEVEAPDEATAQSIIQYSNPLKLAREADEAHAPTVTDVELVDE